MRHNDEPPYPIADPLSSAHDGASETSMLFGAVCARAPWLRTEPGRDALARGRHETNGSVALSRSFPAVLCAEQL